MTPHSSDDDDRTYRSKEELDALKKHDPLTLLKDNLTESGLLDQDQVRLHGRAGQEGRRRSHPDAEAAPYPSDEEATYPVYVEDIRHG